MDNRPRLTWPGRRDDLSGEVFGPTYNGEYLAVDEVVYDEETDTTTYIYRYATDSDFQRGATEMGRQFNLRDRVAGWTVPPIPAEEERT